MAFCFLQDSRVICVRATVWAVVDEAGRPLYLQNLVDPHPDRSRAETRALICD